MPEDAFDGGPVFGQRHLQTLLLFCGLTCAFSMRINLSLAIVAMTDIMTSNPHFNSYAWNEKTKGALLSSFFWGHCLAQVPAGILVHKFGGKQMILWGMLFSVFFTVLIPTGAKIGDWPAVFALRAISGLCQGSILPGTHQVLAKWAPVEERTVLATYAYSGILFGTATMLATGGIVTPTLFGWPGIFYLSGGISLVWILAWAIWAADSPDTCKSISNEERSFIAASIGKVAKTAAESKNLRVPWKYIFTSCPFISLAIVNCSNIWFFWTLATEIPSYFKAIMSLNIVNNAFLSSLPYFGMFLVTIICASFTGFLEQQHILSLATTRRVFSTCGTWIPAVLLIIITYLGPEYMTLAIALFTLTGCLNALTFMGFLYNHIDLSPNFAGVLMSLTTFVANIMSSLAPLTAGFTITDEGDQSNWRIVFCAASFYIFFGNLIFIIFGGFEVQSWNDPNNIRLPRSSGRANRYVVARYSSDFHGSVFR